MQQAKSQSVEGKKKRWGVLIPRIVSAIAAFVLVFGLGISVGQGRLNIGINPTQQVSSNSPTNLDYTSVEAMYDKLRVGFDGDIDNTKLLDGLKQGLAQASGDPYTEYFNVTEAKEFTSQLSGTFSGIGAELGKDTQGNVVVIAPLAGYPAEKAGLKAQDIITYVDDTSTSGLTVSQAVSKIRGQSGTKVTIKVVRDGSQALTFEIVRAEIKVPSVESSILDGTVGYLRVTRFGDDTVRLAREAAARFKEANVKGVVLDMRSDPGGLLDAAVGLSSLWLERSQTVLQEKRGGVVSRTYKATGNPTLNGIKTVVLINEGTASASEITAGALRDNNAATLIGTKSYGKGSVQQLEDLGDGSILKVTIAHWYTPSGKGIDKTGIEPDRKVELSEDDVKNARDPQKQAAIDYINQ